MLLLLFVVSAKLKLFGIGEIFSSFYTRFKIPVFLFLSTSSMLIRLWF